MSNQSLKLSKKNILSSFKNILGLGYNTALAICKELGIKPTSKIKDLKDEHITKLIEYSSSHYKINNNLKMQKSENIAFLSKVNNLTFIRNKAGLPSRGQRTHTNGKTKSRLKNK